MSFIYLASPYSSPDEVVRQQRFELAAAFTAEQLRRGVNIYSPIVHNHDLAVRYDLPKEFDFWQRHNYALLAKASELWVLTLAGYDKSRGVTAEVAMADQLGIKLTFVSL